MKTPLLIPVIKLSDNSTFRVIREASNDFLVVRFQDFVSHNTFEFNKIFYDIVAAGGLHNYLGFNGKILLSLIMKDEIIANVGPKKYSLAINSLKPDMYTTVDGETYEKENKLSIKEIKRMLIQTRELLRLCPYSTPVGLVKGCNESQIMFHVKMLKWFQIKKFIFHIGDFSRNGDNNMINKARNLSYKIRQQVDYLMLYGMGSQKRLLDFSFADAYITFKHFVAATKGLKLNGFKWIRNPGGFDKNIITENFIQMKKNMKSIEEQKTLGDILWVAERGLSVPVLSKKEKHAI